MRIGAHIRTGDGLAQAVSYAVETGCECVQVFAKSPQVWRGPYRSDEELEAFREGCASAGVGPVFTHASYLINAGSADKVMWAMSRKAFADELRRAAGFGAEGVVLHMGTRFSEDPGECAARVASFLARAYDEAGEDMPLPRVLLENAAGAGRSYGREVSELGDALAACLSQGVAAGLCIDTCHGFAAGWDLRGPDGWAAVCDELEQRSALSALRVLHANDCLGGIGEHRDRHAWIGEGSIGEEGFLAMFAEVRLGHVPVVVEMPGDPPEKDAENVARLKRLRAAAGAASGPGPEPA